MSDDPQHRENLALRLFFDPAQCPHGKADILDSAYTTDALVEHLTFILDGGFFLRLTAVNRDHDFDGNLGPHCHNPCGFAADGYPADSSGEYLDEEDPRFARMLERASISPWLHQTGLGGAANTSANRAAAGPTVFADGDADHVHFGAQGSAAGS